uniref:MHC class I-like antigen recognition-like domain-containing protein n=1 Tax=Seriola dumerili TaxID=41447 RepID=A0A3B4TZB5_SERDU
MGIPALLMHSWKAFYTGSTGLTEFPEFVAVNVLDDELMGYFDSRTDRFEGKQSWVMEKLGQQYVDRQTDALRGHSPTFKSNIKPVYHNSFTTHTDRRTLPPGFLRYGAGLLTGHRLLLLGPPVTLVSMF